MNERRDARTGRAGATVAISLGYVAFFVVLPCVFTYGVLSAWNLMLSCTPAGLADLGLLLTASLVVSGGVPAGLSRLGPATVAVVPFDLRVFVLVAVAIGTLVLGFCLVFFVLVGIGSSNGADDEFKEAGVIVAKAVPLLIPAAGFTVAASSTPAGPGFRARRILISTHLAFLMLGASCIWITWMAVCA